MSAVSSGNSSYSDAFTVCASTFERSEPKLWADSLFFAVIGFPHAEDMAIRATRGIADYDQPFGQETKANDSNLSIVFAVVFNLQSDALENKDGIGKVQASVDKRLGSLDRI